MLSGKGLPSLRECYNTNRENGKMKAATRHIPHTPERILDAPDLLDDFYINVMDWCVSCVVLLLSAALTFLAVYLFQEHKQHPGHCAVTDSVSVERFYRIHR